MILKKKVQYKQKSEQKGAKSDHKKVHKNSCQKNSRFIKPERVCQNKATCVGTHWDTGPHRLSQTGTWHWGWAPV